MTLPQRYDMPDDYEWLPGSGRYPLKDAGELAARLRSIVKYDRRGEVLFLEDGSNGWSAWNFLTSGAGAYVVPSVDFTFQSPFSLDMRPGTDGTRLAIAFKYFHSQVYGQMGAELAITFRAVQEALLLRVTHFETADYYDAKIKVDTVNRKIYYADALNAWVLLGSTYYFGEASPETSLLKVVADFSTRCYVRVMLDDLVFNMPAVPLRHAVGVVNKQYYIYIEVTGQVATIGHSYLNHFILTGNEP